MKTFTVLLPLKKKTKNAVQYQEVKELKKKSPVPTVYIYDHAFDKGEDPPPYIKITVEAIHEERS